MTSVRSNKMAILTGTRPGIVKFSPLIREAEARNSESILIHSGQHYSPEMDAAFFTDLELPHPNHRLEGLEKLSHQGEQTAEMLRGIESILLQEKPAILIVGGDCNTHLAGALAARKLQIPVAHVEAGMRSWDWRMPEEHNRVLIDHISELLFVHSDSIRRNLEQDGVRGETYVVGTTAADAVEQNLEIAQRKSDALERTGVTAGEYFLATCHRQENVDDKGNLTSILTAFERCGEQYGVPVVFPVHPRTTRRIREFELESFREGMQHVRFTDPVGYLDFLKLLSGARLLLTDSGGGVQEACILGVPCVTLRISIEWVETVEIGANILSGPSEDRIVAGVDEFVRNPREWSNPFGDGNTGRRIIDIVEQAIRDGIPSPGIPEQLGLVPNRAGE